MTSWSPRAGKLARFSPSARPYDESHGLGPEPVGSGRKCPVPVDDVAEPVQGLECPAGGGAGRVRVSSIRAQRARAEGKRGVDRTPRCLQVPFPHLGSLFAAPMRQRLRTGACPTTTAATTAHSSNPCLLKQLLARSSRTMTVPIPRHKFLAKVDHHEPSPPTSELASLVSTWWPRWISIPIRHRLHPLRAFWRRFHFLT
jgi:hypothetical protein